MPVANTIFVEELNANDAEARALTNFGTSRTVRDLKTAIARGSGQPGAWQQIEVRFGSIALDELSRTLSSYSIVNGDTLYYVRSTAPASASGNGTKSAELDGLSVRTKVLDNLFFQDFEKKTYTLNKVPISETVTDVVNRVGREKAIDVEWRQFLWGGKELWPNNNARANYGLQDISATLSSRYGGVRCETNDLCKVARFTSQVD